MTKDEAALYYLQQFVDNASGKIKWTGTKLSGFSGGGAFHCKDCKYLRGRAEGKIYYDTIGRSRCNHPVVMLDPQVEHEEPKIQADGTVDTETPLPAIIPDVTTFCCEFVNNDIRVKS